MDLSISFYLIAVFSVLLTGISKSGFGGGLGVMSVPMMSLFVSPQFAAAVLMPILLVMDILIVFRYREHWSSQVIATMLPGALIGLVLGAFMFRWMDANAIKLIVGILALVFVLQFVVGRYGLRHVRKPSALTGQALGLVSGFASFVAHAGGPPVKGYLLQQNLDKTDFVGTNTMFFFTLNAIKTVAYGSVGTMGMESMLVSLILTPFLFIGVFAGAKLHRFMDQNIFFLVVYGFLALTAAKLLSDSIPALIV